MKIDYLLCIILVIILLGLIVFLFYKKETYTDKPSLFETSCKMEIWNEKLDKFKNLQKKELDDQMDLSSCDYTREPRTIGMSWGVGLQNLFEDSGIKIGDKDVLNLESVNKMITGFCGLKKFGKGDLSTFVNDYNIDLGKSEKCKNINGISDIKNTKARDECFKKFNSADDFFTRDLDRDILTKRMDNLKGKISDLTTVLLSPADNYCMMFKDENNAKSLWIKGKQFTIGGMIGDNDLYQNKSVSVIVNRLAPGHYHKFHSPVKGIITGMRLLGTNFLSVQPAIVQKQNVFTENKRVILTIATEKFGKVSMVIVGASCVGSIAFDNRPDLNAKLDSIKSGGINYTTLSAPVELGELIGAFHYGGSTIVLVIPNEDRKYEYNPYVLSASAQGIETQIDVLDPLMTTN